MKLKNDYIKLHKLDLFNGYCTEVYRYEINDIIEETNSKSILDYGCGKGFQYSKLKLDVFWNVLVDCYDPGVSVFSKLPNNVYDGVLCIEVMEHIPEEEVDNTLKNIFIKAKKFAFFSISLVYDKQSYKLKHKRLIDGSNVHVTIKSKEWWEERIKVNNTNNIRVVSKFTT